LFNVQLKEISMNAITQTSSATAAAPTEKQVLRLQALGATAIPSTRSEASQLISKLIASRDMQPATLAQVGRAAALGGRDLPGAGVREKSTQIFLLEALVAFDNAQAEADINAAAELLVARVRERFVKPLTITITAPAADAPM
jgi:hypothetical protein